MNCVVKKANTLKKLFVKKHTRRNFPGGPVVKIPSFHCKGHGFDPWSGN